MKTDWIVVRGDGHYTLECSRCLDSYTPTLPIHLDLFLAMSKAFVKIHKRCVPHQDLVDWANDPNSSANQL